MRSALFYLPASGRSLHANKKRAASRSTTSNAAARLTYPNPPTEKDISHDCNITGVDWRNQSGLQL